MSGLPIRNSVDLTVARNVLRRRIAGERYTPTFRARSAAVLTALVELIFTTKAPGYLDIRTIAHADKKGVEFVTSITGAELQTQYDHLTAEIKDVADEVEWSTMPDHARIVAHVWFAE